MTSLEFYASRNRFSNFIAAAALPAIVAGFVATAGTALWSYSRAGLPETQIAALKTVTPPCVCDTAARDQHPEC